MKHYKLKQIKEFVEFGWAIDVTTREPDQLPKHYEKVGYSTGVNGLNGCLVKDLDTGLYYAVVGRSSNIFILM